MPLPTPLAVTVQFTNCKTCPYIRGSSITRHCSKVVTAPTTYKVVTANWDKLQDPTLPETKYPCPILAISLQKAILSQESQEKTNG